MCGFNGFVFIVQIFVGGVMEGGKEIKGTLRDARRPKNAQISTLFKQKLLPQNQSAGSQSDTSSYNLHKKEPLLLLPF